jgi:predicted MFS family arabinose efflux permease
VTPEGGVPPPSGQSRRGLDWLNFFMSDVQQGFGSFVSFYLADRHWTTEAVGIVLTAGGLAGVVSQVPAGALVDAIPAKRLLVAIGVAMIVGAALLLAFFPSFLPVALAEVLHGATAGIVGPGIAAISLGLVGRRAMSARIGRNHRFDAAGNAITAALLGLVGTYLAKRTIFLGAALLAIPTLVALGRIRPGEIDYGRARNAADTKKPREVDRFAQLLHNRPLLIYAACAVLFRFADASMLPIVSESLGAGSGAFSSLFLSALIVVPQIIVAVLAPWVGEWAESWGRKPLLLIGFGVEPVRGVLIMLVPNSPYLVGIQLLDGVSGAIFAVLAVLIVTDLTAGSGRFNFARGVIGMLTGLAASLSTTATGYIAALLGHSAVFLAMAGIAAAATALVWLFLPESRPERYLD